MDYSATGIKAEKNDAFDKPLLHIALPANIL